MAAPAYSRDLLGQLRPTTQDVLGYSTAPAQGSGVKLAAKAPMTDRGAETRAALSKAPPRARDEPPRAASSSSSSWRAAPKAPPAPPPPQLPTLYATEDFNPEEWTNESGIQHISLKAGDKVYVQEGQAEGWTLVSARPTVDPAAMGWVPTYMLTETAPRVPEEPPRPPDAPPAPPLPAAPPLPSEAPPLPSEAPPPPPWEAPEPAPWDEPVPEPPVPWDAPAVDLPRPDEAFPVFTRPREPSMDDEAVRRLAAELDSQPREPTMDDDAVARLAAELDAAEAAEAAAAKEEGSKKQAKKKRLAEKKAAAKAEAEMSNPLPRANLPAPRLKAGAPQLGYSASRVSELGPPVEGFTAAPAPPSPVKPVPKSAIHFAPKPVAKPPAWDKPPAWNFPVDDDDERLRKGLAPAPASETWDDRAMARVAETKAAAKPPPKAETKAAPKPEPAKAEPPVSVQAQARATATAILQAERAPAARPAPGDIADPLLRDMVKEELKLKKKLREVLQLKERGNLDAAQQRKVAEQGFLEEQLEIAGQQIDELMREVSRSAPAAKPAPAPKPAVKKPAASNAKQAALNPLPRANLQQKNLITWASAGSASRVAYAPPARSVWDEE